MASVGSAIMSVGSSASAPRDNDDAIAATSKERKDSWTYEANLGSRTVADVEASGSSRGGGSTRNLLSGERQTLQALCHTSSPHLTLITAHISIAGFQLYTNVDWILSRDRIFSTFAVYTGRADHIAHMAVAEFSADSSAYSPAVRRAFKQFEGDKLRMHETGPGVVMVGNAEWFSKASR
ncbi:hypothetical protein DFS34DRAFT_48531 [Phlyctochytrium arcticum]|nr:hypothetical protein DFS34DRAFT_48531 [Phlyctochytrium arcticum]